VPELAGALTKSPVAATAFLPNETEVVKLKVIVDAFQVTWGSPIPYASWTRETTGNQLPRIRIPLY